MAWVCPSCGNLNSETCLKCSCGYLNSSIEHHTSPAASAAQIIYAGFWKRLSSLIIDGVVFLPFFFLRIWVDSHSKFLSLVFAIFYIVLMAAYEVCFVAKFGQTIGKMAVGIKIVKVDGDAVSWKEAFLRHSVNIFFAILYGIAMCYAITKIADSEYVNLTWKARNHKIYELYPSWFSWANILSNLWVWSEVVVLLFNKKRRALHDFIAGTVVIHAKM